MSDVVEEYRDTMPDGVMRLWAIDAIAEITRLRAEADALRVDVVRYRWLRDQAAWTDAKNPCPYSEQEDGQLRCITAGLDDAIDAAMGADA